MKKIIKCLWKCLPASWKRKMNFYISRYMVGGIVPHDDALHVAILLGGGMGDLLIHSMWIKEFYRRMDCAIEVDIYVPVPYHHIFLLMPYKLRLFDKSLFDRAVGYDLKFEIVHFVRIHKWVPHRIIEKSRVLYEILEKIDIHNDKYKKYCYESPALHGEWANLMIKLGKTRVTELWIDGAFDFGQGTKGLLHLDCGKYSVMDRLDLNDKKYITIHNGSETLLSHPEYSHQTKIWPIHHYSKLCKLIKERYPDLIIVQLGVGNSIPIECVDKNCLSKLSMPESLIVLKHALLHIDVDSGLVHARRQMHGKSVALFGPTPVEYVGYNENININSPHSCINCMWMLNDWFYKCASTGSGYPVPCMEAILPEAVMAEMEYFLDRKLNEKIETVRLASKTFSADELEERTNILPNIEHDKKGFPIRASEQWKYLLAENAIMAYSRQAERGKPRIASIGIDTGLLRYLHKYVHDITAYDLTQGFVPSENTEKSFLRWCEENGIKMEWGSAFNIPAENETFDIIACISILEHIPQRKYALKEMLRILKPDGVLIVVSDAATSGGTGFAEDASRQEPFSPEMIHDTLSAIGTRVIIDNALIDIESILAGARSDKLSKGNGVVLSGFVLKKEFFADD